MILSLSDKYMLHLATGYYTFRGISLINLMLVLGDYDSLKIYFKILKKKKVPLVFATDQSKLKIYFKL